MFALKLVSVLIVDDEFEVRESLYDLFVLKGFSNVKMAENGFRALELVEQESQSGRHFDIIITDVIMPGMNGFEFVDEVVKVSPGSLVFMMTATHLDDIKVRYFSGQIQGFFKKPVDINFLFQIVVDILQMVKQ